MQDRKLIAGSDYLGKRHHPAIGIRLPEIVLPGIIGALKKNRCASGLMLSFGRETAPEKVINARPGQYEITLGHTGTSIRKYMTLAAAAAQEAGIPAEMEADHLIITVSSALAVKRIEGVKIERGMSEEALRASLRYNIGAIEEAAATGQVRAFTSDTSNLFDFSAEKLRDTALQKACARAFSKTDQSGILALHPGRHRMTAADGKDFVLTISAQKAMRLCLKYRRSLAVNAKLYKEIGKRVKVPFAFEISLDETEKPTPAADLFIYLGEWRRMGLPCDYVAPNVGFTKRSDYRGGMETLRQRVAGMAAIADRYDVILSFHSGSGSTPYSGKGKGVYDILLQCTRGRLKYKISGVYIELLLEMLAAQKKGEPARSLYESMFSEVIEYLRHEIKTNGPLSSGLLRQQMKIYEKRHQPLDPRADVFRFHSFLAMNFRDAKGRRYFRDQVVSLYQGDSRLRQEIDREISALTVRLIEGLHFDHNY